MVGKYIFHHGDREDTKGRRNIPAERPPSKAYFNREEKDFSDHELHELHEKTLRDFLFANPSTNDQDKPWLTVTYQGLFLTTETPKYEERVVSRDVHKSSAVVEGCVS